MRKVTTRKLQLNKHSLRNLTAGELDAVAGGGGGRNKETVALSICRVCNTKRGC